MKTRERAKFAIEIIANPEQHDLISRVTGINKRELGRIEGDLRKKAFLAYTPSMLEIAVSAVASMSQGGVKAVQVGANNGRDYFRPLVHRYASAALLVEPIPQLIDEIKENYKKYTGDLIVENAALSDNVDSDAFELNVLDPKLWDQYKQVVGRSATEIASIYDGPLIDKISKRLNYSLEEAKRAVIKITCPQYTLAGLLNKHKFSDADVLQIDCEGHDFNVIKSLGDICPHIINFESMNLDQTQWNGWKAWAATNGYGWIQGPSDTLAIKGAHFACEC